MVECGRLALCERKVIKRHWVFSSLLYKDEEETLDH